MEVNKEKYKFEAETKKNTTILTLSGRISSDRFSEDVISASKVKDALEGIENDIVIRLNSGGGDVFEGIEIYNYLKHLPNRVVIEVTGLAGSAGSIVAMGGDEVVMCTGGQMMIHEASTIAYGNKDAIKKTLNALETVDESLIDIYHEKTGADKDVISGWLEEETWFTAEEAVKQGLADRVKSQREENLQKEVAELRNMVQRLVAEQENRIVAEKPIVEEVEEEKEEQPQGLARIFGGK